MATTDRSGFARFGAATRLFQGTAGTTAFTAVVFDNRFEITRLVACNTSGGGRRIYFYHSRRGENGTAPLTENQAIIWNSNINSDDELIKGTQYAGQGYVFEKGDVLGIGADNSGVTWTIYGAPVQSR